MLSDDCFSGRCRRPSPIHTIRGEKTTNNCKASMLKAEKEREKAEKEKQASKSQFAILESEKTSLIKALE